MSFEILSNVAASIAELKRNPLATIKSAHGEPLAILSNDKPVCYCIPPELFESMLEMLGDLYLAEIIKEREGEESIEVDINDL
jgi:antitoxin StbD